MTSLLVPPRYDQPELLDVGAGTPADVQESLGDMWRINCYLGGVPALIQHLFPRLRASSEVMTVADIGTGSAEIPVMIARWAARHGVRVHVIAMDYAMRHLDVARRNVQPHPNVQLMQADANRLPFASERVDYFISSLVLHHFVPEQVIELLGEAFALARKGIIMTDGERGWLPLLGFKIVQPVFARSYLTRHDAVASVRRAYTPSELRQLAADAGLTNARVYRHPLWRMTLVADK